MAIPPGSSSTTSDPSRRRLRDATTPAILDGIGEGSSMLITTISAPMVGNGVQIGAYDTNHALSFFQGATLPAIVDFEEIQPFNGKRTFIRNVRPMVDGGTPAVAIATRENLEAVVTYGNPTTINSKGFAPQRMSGRYVRARLTLPAGSTFTHIQGIELDADPIGVR